MNSASYEYRNMSARRGAQFVPMGMPVSRLIRYSKEWAPFDVQFVCPSVILLVDRISNLKVFFLAVSVCIFLLFSFCFFHVPMYKSKRFMLLLKCS